MMSRVMCSGPARARSAQLDDSSSDGQLPSEERGRRQLADVQFGAVARRRLLDSVVHRCRFHVHRPRRVPLQRSDNTTSRRSGSRLTDSLICQHTGGI